MYKLTKMKPLSSSSGLVSQFSSTTKSLYLDLIFTPQGSSVSLISTVTKGSINSIIFCLLNTGTESVINKSYLFRAKLPKQWDNMGGILSFICLLFWVLIYNHLSLSPQEMSTFSHNLIVKQFDPHFFNFLNFCVLFICDFTTEKHPKVKKKFLKIKKE